MHIAYYDESGDDGYPSSSSNLFALSGLYLHYLRWQDVFDDFKDFRRDLKNRHGFHVDQEMHVNHFLKGKQPFDQYGYSLATRIDIVTEFCDAIGSLDVRIVNVVINKPPIQDPGYDVLDTAVKYSIQRIENDLDPQRNPDERFLFITDEGRVGTMRKTARRIRRYNPIPSVIRPGTTYQQPIESLIEDPLPKDSAESYFIQMADVIAYVVYLYVGLQTGNATIPNRLQPAVDRQVVIDWMDELRPSLNTAAASGDPYGVKIHPT